MFSSVEFGDTLFLVTLGCALIFICVGWLPNCLCWLQRALQVNIAFCILELW